MRKKIMLATGALVLLLCAIVCWMSFGQYKPQAFVVDGEDFSARVEGGEMLLTLPSNPSTGYSWVIAQEPEIFASDYDSYISDNSGLLGGGGSTQFHIIALDEGSATMLLQYKQPWEGGNTQASYELSLEISRHQKIQLQIDSVSFTKLEE